MRVKLFFYLILLDSYGYHFDKIILAYYFDISGAFAIIDRASQQSARTPREKFSLFLRLNIDNTDGKSE